MIDFVQKQLDASEKLFELMREDHKQRMQEMIHWSITTTSLVNKLEQRDETIRELRERLAKYEGQGTNEQAEL